MLTYLSAGDARFMLDLEQIASGIILPVRAHAGARRNAVLGIRAGALRIAVTAAPEKGKANQAIIALLSKTLGVSKSMIEIVSGDTSAQKRLLVRNIEMERLRQTVASVIAGCDQ
jgi:uncharacterized protein (TIGR00251 family)